MGTEPRGIGGRGGGDTFNKPGVTTFQASVGTTQSALPAAPVPDGYELTLLTLRNDNSENILIDGTYPIVPGAGVTLGVKDASDVEAVAAAGTQTIYGIVEVA